MQLSKMYLPWGVDNTHWGIEIIDGKYKDTIIQIENIEFDKNDTSQLQLEYHTINIPDGILKEDYESSEFVDMMQLIISDILAKAIEHYQEENDNRTNDSLQSDSQ